MKARARTLLLALVAVAAACAAAPPLVARYENGAWRAQPFDEVERSGRRDGAEVTFTVVLEGPTRITIEGLIRIEPGARLAAGHWTETGDGAERSGPFRAEALDFLGGQGGRPSVGGRLTLQSGGGEAVYQVNLPTAELAP